MDNIMPAKNRFKWPHKQGPNEAMWLEFNINAVWPNLQKYITLVCGVGEL